uniref:Uncharacterized protein n=1 Tax=Avena sativa TaxID=4498 RepID=A0ACD5TQX6_AVESA
MVAMATVPLSSHARTMDVPAAFPLPASCYSHHFPNCTEDRCKMLCGGDGQPPAPGAFCNYEDSCCCPV